MSNAITRAICKKSFYEYFLWSWDIRHRGDELIDSWHIKYFCDEVQMFIENDDEQLMSIICPPRILKSEIVNVALSEWLSIISNGTISVMTYSANQDLSSTLNVKKRDVINSIEFQQLFGIQLKEDLNRQNEFAFVNGGILRGGSVSSGQIGKGSDVIIYDDLLDYKTAATDVGRQSAYDLFQNTQTRFNNPRKKKVIIINQRLHVDDMIGFLESKKTKFDRQILLPALDDKGQPTIPNILPIKVLNEYLISLGEDKFNAQYLQKPSYGGSLVFDKSKFKFIDSHENLNYGYGQCYIDVADEGEDKIAMPMIRRADEKWIAVDLFAEKGATEITIPLIANKIKEHKMELVIVEKNNGGKSFATLLAIQLEKIGYVPKIITKQTTSNKYLRIATNQGLIQEHIHFIKTDNVMYNNFLSEIFKYTENSKHDDEADSLSMLVQYISDKKLL